MAFLIGVEYISRSVATKVEMGQNGQSIVTPALKRPQKGRPAVRQVDFQVFFKENYNGIYSELAELKRIILRNS